MLIEDWRPKLYCKDIECQNLSPNGRVFFIEDGHKYYHEEDVLGDSIQAFEDSKYVFRSPTGLIANFYEHFDTIPQAKKYVVKHKLPITWEQLVFAWDMLGDIAADEGTTLHGYGESLFNKWGMEPPNLIKTAYVDALYKELNSKYILAKTELLVYSLELRLAGQVDLLMKNHDSSEYHILDYKFIKEPLEMKSYYNRFTRKYKMMSGPFSRLMDTNFFHYSIQLELYRYLMGAVGRKVKTKRLMVVTPEGYELVHALAMKIWVSSDGVLHARYKYYKDKIYDSSQDPAYLENPYQLI
jgi:hypothetical protein